MDWAQALNSIEASTLSIVGAQLAHSATPVIKDPATGRIVAEGQPSGRNAGGLFGVSPVYLIGGAVALLLVGFFVLRK